MKPCSVIDCDKPGTRRGGLCQMHSWRLRHYGDVHRVRARRLCSVADCSRPNKANGLCQLHRRRFERGLPTDYVASPLAKKRYRMQTRHSHPLADVRGRVYVHRVALYDSVDGSRLPCFWCGAPLEWLVNLCVDHFNHDRHDNNPTNLLPACNGCNAGRTSKNPRVRQPIYLPVSEFVWTADGQQVGS
jgi:hypothetical protein